MKKYLLILIAMVASGFVAQAQPHKLTSEQKERFFMSKMKMIQQELNLTEEQTNDFTPIYRSYNQEMSKMFDENRQKERCMKKATADDAINVVNERIEVKIRVLRLQKDYYGRFKTVLTPEQILRLDGAEHKIQNKIMERHGRKHNGARRQQGGRQNPQMIKNQ